MSDDNVEWAKANLHRFQSHKQVWAGRITSVDAERGRVLIEGNCSWSASQTWLAKHQDDIVPGQSWLVFYDDGYASVSPEKAFYEGYTKIEG